MLTTHVVVGEEAARQDVQRFRNQVRALAGEQGLDFDHITIEIEYAGDECAQNPKLAQD